MNDKNLILKKIKPIFTKVFKNKSLKLTLNSSATNIKNWDSLAHINIVLNIERMFKIKFKISEIAELKNVGEMIDLVLKKKRSSK